jgi:hypothetical protein
MSSETKCVLKIPDRRTARFVINYLKGSGIHTLGISLYTTDLSSIEEQINNVLCDPAHGGDHLKVEEIKKRIDLHMLPDTYFSWLKDNVRAVYWIWGKLYHRKEDKILSECIGLLQRNKLLTLKMLPAEEPIPSHSGRFQAITLLFDVESGLSLDQKVKMLSGFYDEWVKNISSKKILTWLDVKNADMCTWAYNYIKNYRAEIGCDEEKVNIKDLFNTESIPLESLGMWNEIPTPEGHEETVHSIFFIYDLWNASPERKKLFLIEINKAWNQKKVRDNRKGKKTLNTHINIDTKAKLDFLADKYNMKINQVIEMLIIDKYKEGK